MAYRRRVATAGYPSVVGFAPDMTGTAAVSWIGEVVVDIEGVDALIAAVSG